MKNYNIYKQYIPPSSDSGYGIPPTRWHLSIISIVAILSVWFFFALLENFHPLRATESVLLSTICTFPFWGAAGFFIWKLTNRISLTFWIIIIAWALLNGAFFVANAVFDHHQPQYVTLPVIGRERSCDTRCHYYALAKTPIMPRLPFNIGGTERVFIFGDTYRNPNMNGHIDFVYAPGFLGFPWVLSSTYSGEPASP